MVVAAVDGFGGAIEGLGVSMQERTSTTRRLSVLSSVAISVKQVGTRLKVMCGNCGLYEDPARTHIGCVVSICFLLADAPGELEYDMLITGE